MNEEKSRQLWKIIQEAGDYLKGQLPDHPNHPKGRNPYAHVLSYPLSSDIMALSRISTRYL